MKWIDAVCAKQFRRCLTWVFYASHPDERVRFIEVAASGCVGRSHGFFRKVVYAICKVPGIGRDADSVNRAPKCLGTEIAIFVGLSCGCDLKRPPMDATVFVFSGTSGKTSGEFLQVQLGTRYFDRAEYKAISYLQFAYLGEQRFRE